MKPESLATMKLDRREDPTSSCWIQRNINTMPSSSLVKIDFGIGDGDVSSKIHHQGEDTCASKVDATYVLNKRIQSEKERCQLKLMEKRNQKNMMKSAATTNTEPPSSSTNDYALRKQASLANLFYSQMNGEKVDSDDECMELRSNYGESDASSYPDHTSFASLEHGDDDYECTEERFLIITKKESIDSSRISSSSRRSSSCRSVYRTEPSSHISLSTISSTAASGKTASREELWSSHYHCKNKNFISSDVVESNPNDDSIVRAMEAAIISVVTKQRALSTVVGNNKKKAINNENTTSDVQSRTVTTTSTGSVLLSTEAGVPSISGDQQILDVVYPIRNDVSAISSHSTSQNDDDNGSYCSCTSHDEEDEDDTTSSDGVMVVHQRAQRRWSSSSDFSDSIPTMPSHINRLTSPIPIKIGFKPTRGGLPLLSDDEHVNPPTTTTTATNTITNKKEVSFGQVHVRYYERILGDHPSCQSGPSMGIGWKYYRSCSINIEVWESRRYHSRHQRGGHYYPNSSPKYDYDSLLLSRKEREEMLRQLGYKQWEIAKAIRQNLKVKHRRRQTIRQLNHMFQPLEVVSEKVQRKVFTALTIKM